MMISIGLVIQNSDKVNEKQSANIYNFKIQNMSASANMIVRNNTEKKESPTQMVFQEVEMETAPASVIVPPRVEVYESMTL